ncbi:F1F0-ATP synthase subunit E [Fusarium pseudoanthophilum]|uniref:F1F0-ATP synthase subunit E n=1 Tax=Fusarium pseudoanthophilum TaxID=48495 RepID=A0A8H5Q848_9HYPO|nr:F1F0-ATP synthase subunit E [Fusarium pseudoanthophilum]
MEIDLGDEDGHVITLAGSLATGSSLSELPAASGWLALFGSEWKNCDFSRRLFNSSPQADASNPLEPLRLGPLTSHCRPPTIVNTDPFALRPVRPFFATLIPNGFDRSERACYPPRFGRSTVSQARALDYVLRWSALGLGIFYGFTHQRAITASQKAEHAQHEYEKKEKLIQQAKAEFAKKNNPTSGDSVITDPSDPKFDLEKLLLKVQKENP